MKPNLFYLFVICYLLTFFTALAEIKPTSPPLLSERAANLVKEECKTIIKNYYFDIKSITGENIDSSADQNNLIDLIQQDCFRNPKVVVDNNIPEISQDNLNIKDYLKSISVLSDKIEKIGFNEDITLSDIYYNSTDNYYYLIAYINQRVDIKNVKGADKKVDFYINFNPENGLKPKIYSIQNHKEGVLDKQNLAKIIPDEEVEKTTDSTKPYFLFDVTPNNADINIDGKIIVNDGNKIETTSGNHVVEITAPNYQPLKFGVLASDTGVQHIVRILPPKHGYLFVNSADNSLQDPQVYIDTNMVGNIPLSNYQLSVGAHDIEIKGGNNFYKSYHVTITDENATTLNIQGSSNVRWEEKKNTDSPSPPTDVSFQAFYDELSPYGQWVEDPQYGDVFVPNVSPDFRPYFTDGHWAMTDDGNTWVSDEPWGWACYHYGRWTYNSYYNWVWVPGYEWAPAWVTWRFGDQACGWAPLSPGLSAGVSNGCPDTWWVFVGPAHLYNSGYSNYWHGPENNVTYIRQTTIINNYTVNTTRSRYNFGPSSADVERVTHNPVEKYHIRELGRPGNSVQSGRDITIYKANLNSPSPYAARPQNVYSGIKPIQRPQNVTGINREANFNHDLQSGKLQPRQSTFNPNQPQQYRQLQNGQREQPRTQQVVQPMQQQHLQQQSTQQEQQRQQQAAQQAQQQRLQQQNSQSEQQRQQQTIQQAQIQKQQQSKQKEQSNRLQTGQQTQQRQQTNTPPTSQQQTTTKPIRRQQPQVRQQQPTQPRQQVVKPQPVFRPPPPRRKS